MDNQKRQQIQYDHDLDNHFDILTLSRIERLKHYGLHFAKYAGRFARGEAEPKSRQQTLVDAFLVSLSAANALNQLLPEIASDAQVERTESEFTECAGRFADACEKIDHLEEFRDIAIKANADIFEWIVLAAKSDQLDIDSLAHERRQVLASRAVHAPG